MKFVYQYRTSDNTIHAGQISAEDRESAFRALKQRGIRPSKLDDAPGILNKVLGKGKRWIAIFILALAVVISVITAELKTKVVAQISRTVTESATCEQRGQIYGAPIVLREAFSTGWAETFTNITDRLFAAYAVPGRIAVIPSGVDVALLVIPADCEIMPDDLAEVAKMKRIVNGMKHEARTYIAAGGTIQSYFKRMEKRQRQEIEILERTRNELNLIEDPQVWRERNNALRAMGLPMIDSEEDR